MNPEQIHQHQRKRIHQKLQKFPHPKKHFRFIDDLVTFVSVVFPFTTIPQIYNIWVSKSVEGVSFWTWFLALIFTIPLLVYAIAHKDKRLTLMWSLWTLFYVIVISGLSVYQ